MSDRMASVTEASSPAIKSATFAWRWCGTDIPVGYEVLGPAGAEPVLMLPALSTVSTRDELRALARHLGSRRCIITDWPGFGDTARPRLDYDRALCRGFLEDLVTHLGGERARRSFPVVACGHAAGYAIDLEARHPGTFTQLVLIAPTWRGPLPTVMGGRKPIQARIRRWIHAPVIGELLYRRSAPSEHQQPVEDSHEVLCRP
jgi:pimeloyl-ACP methyl ester carboxylesterase